MSATPLKILLIDDNEIDVKVVSKLLDKSYDEPYELLVSNALEDGKRMLESGNVHVALLDLHLPDSNIEQTLEFVANYQEKFPFIILSSIHDKQQRINAIQKGAQDYLVKNDFDAPLLTRVINYSIERHQLNRELHSYTKELKEKEQRLTESQAIAQLGNWELLLDNNTIEWSREAKEILELIEQTPFSTLEWFANLLKSEERKEVWNVFRQAIETNRDFNIDVRVMLPSRKVKYLNLRVRSTEVHDETKKKIRGTIQDITSRKWMEAALAASEDKYSRLFKESNDAIWITTIEGKFLDFNPATVELFGYAPEELKNLYVFQLYYNPYERERARKALEEKGALRDYELMLRRKDGIKIDCIVTASFWKSNDGKQQGYQGIIRDITEKKRTEELIRNKEISERSARLKQRFLANMSHEIRTPITAISGLTHLIIKTELTPQQAQYVEGIRTSSGHLLALVNDILDFSKIEEGKIKFHSIEFSLEEHLVQLAKTMEHSAINKGIELILDYDHAIPAQVVGDPVKLNQVIFNLLSNAIKFTDKGYVKLSARLIEDAKNAIVISLNVQDTGMGIPENKLTTIFRSFTQLGKDVTKTAEGTGLGLSITRQLIELQGGTISVKSKVNEGSTFEVVMLFKKTLDTPTVETSEEKIAEKKIDIGYKKILIVEDKKLNQLVTSEMLKSWWKNIEIDVADDGKIAVDMLRTKKIDLVLMDVQMPVMDGYEATKAIRNELKIAYTDLPILAMTAYNTENEMQQCLEAGMNDVMAKPFEPEQLYQKIIGLLHHGSVDYKTTSEIPTAYARENDTLDLSYLDTITGGNASLKEKILEMLIDETPDELFSLRQFTREKNWKRVRAVSHKMKSGITYLGLPKTLDAVKRVEEYSENEKFLERIPDLVERINIATTKAINELVTARMEKHES
ncbi:MAG: response regulator [Chitinophagales bacterium]|nr:response regulator [Chitinophagales bacterium]